MPPQVEVMGFGGCEQSACLLDGRCSTFDLRNDECGVEMIFDALALCMTTNYNGTQNGEARPPLDGHFVVRIETATLADFRMIAERDGRTPSNLARKVITDFVRGRQTLNAVPPEPTVQAAVSLPTPHPSSPWDI